MQTISSKRLKPRLTGDREIAFLDVREHGQYGEGHPFFCVPMPFSVLEHRAEVLLPRRAVDVVLMDDGDGIAERAAERLAEVGYDNVAVLDGGAEGWAAAGYTLYQGVNVPSKSFGELLEHAADTPRITADELQEWRNAGRDMLVLDGRSPAEYRKMSLPDARSCPNAELAYRVHALAPNPETTVIINCAGRTRSILGVENLRLIDIDHPVYALENGTQGWRLAGHDLRHGVEPQELPLPRPADLERLADLARELTAKHNLKVISTRTLEDWQTQKGRTTYLFDVRTAEEYAATHWPGARHAPGGQLVQATDEFVAVRNARIVLSDDVGLRAATTAVWLQRMGHDVYRLDADARSFASPTHEPQATQSELSERFRTAASTASVILDVSPSMLFRKAHVEGARWVTRAALSAAAFEHAGSVLITSQRPELIDGIVHDLTRSGLHVTACPGGPEVWSGAGYAVVPSPDSPPDDECIDYLFFVHDRHDGNLDASRRYLEWEVGLVKQLDAQERSVFDLSA